MEIKRQAEEVETPAVEIKAPALKIEIPADQVETPNVEDLTPDFEIEASIVESETPSMEIERPAEEVETPAVEIEAPALEIEIPADQVETTNVEDLTPDFKFEASFAEFERPTGKIKIPAIDGINQPTKLKSHLTAMKSKIETLKFEVESIFLNDEAPALENETFIEADVATIKHESTAEEAEISANRGFLEQMRKSSQEDVELEAPEDEIKTSTVEGGPLTLDSSSVETNLPVMLPAVKVRSDPAIWAEGPGLENCFVGDEADFQVFTSGDGHGSLSVRVKRPNAKSQVGTWKGPKRIICCKYNTDVDGKYTVKIKWDHVHIRGSPFKIKVSKRSETQAVEIEAPAIEFELQVRKFPVIETPVVIAIEAPSIEFDSPIVEVEAPAGQLEIPSVENDSPIVKIESPDDEIVIPEVTWAEGPGLTDCFVGDKGEFQVLNRHVGNGSLTVQVKGPRGKYQVSKWKGAKRTLTYRYNPEVAGKYIINIKWEEEHIIGSPFKIKVRDRPIIKTNTEKLLWAEGSGLMDCFVGDPADLKIYNRRPGQGTISVRVKGPRARPQVIKWKEAQKTVTCKYSPKKAGKYAINIKWEKEHIIGSPFKIKVRERLANKIKAPAVEIEAPSVKVETPAVETQGPAVEIEAPAIEVETPSLGIEAVAIKLEAPAVEVETPAIDIEAPSVELEGETPAFEIEAPTIELEAPADKIEKPAIKAPAVEIETPAIEIEGPAVEIEAPAVKIENQIENVETKDVEIEASVEEFDGPFPVDTAHET